MTTQTPPLSLGEIGFIGTRAAVGVGVPFGLGEDLAGSLIRLACAGFDPTAVCVAALDSLERGDSTGALEVAAGEGFLDMRGTGGQAVSAIYAGPAVRDHLLAHPGIGRILAEAVDQPLLLAAALNPGDVEVTVSWDGARVAFAGGTWREIAARDETALLSPGPSRITVEAGSGTAERPSGPVWTDKEFQAAREHALNRGVSVEVGAWERTFSYFERCLVPSNRQSRLSGAGAGLVDRD